MILDLGCGIFSAGYKCIAHCRKMKFNVTVEKIKGQIITRSGSVIECKLKLETFVDLGIGDRMIEM